MMPSNKGFTNRVTRSVLEIKALTFTIVQKRSGFVFLGTDRVIRLVNRHYQSRH